MTTTRRERMARSHIEKFESYGAWQGQVHRESAEKYRAHGVDPSNARWAFRNTFPNWEVLDDRLGAAFRRAFRAAYAQES